jgi:hypothetical protein
VAPVLEGESNGNGPDDEGDDAPADDAGEGAES